MEKELNQRLEEQEKKQIRRFGFNFAMGMTVLFLVSLWRNFALPFKIGVAGLGLAHLCFAFLNYRWLYPTYKLVLSISILFGNILTTIIFTVVFYLLFTPIAFVLRLCKKDVIGNNSREPRWLPIPETANNPERVKRLY
jgi:hypothetical protein